MLNQPPVRLLSCDTHLEHFATVIKAYVPAKYHETLETAPLKFTLGPISHYGPEGVTLSALSGFGRWRDIKPGAFDVRTDKIPGTYGGAKEYLDWLDEDGVTAAVCLPSNSIGPALGMMKANKDWDGYRALVQGYNNWLSDFCSEAPDRLLGGAMVMQTSIDEAIAEMRRTRKLKGVCTLAPGAFPNASNTPKPEDDRFYAEALDLDFPITLHGGISSPRAGLNTTLDLAAWIVGHIEVTTGGPFSATQLILSGVFDRLPNLKFIVLECGAGWLPFSMDVMNHMYDRYRHWTGTTLKNPPSWYCRSGNLIWNIIADHPAIKYIDDIGVDVLTWSSDFPHSNSEYPFSRQRALELTASLSPVDRDKVLWANAAEFYGLEKGAALSAPYSQAAE